MEPRNMSATLVKRSGESSEHCTACWPRYKERLASGMCAMAACETHGKYGGESGACGECCQANNACRGCKKKFDE
eukprot:g14520.t1